MLVREARRRSEGALEPQHIEFHSHGLGVFQRSCETFPGKPSASEDHEKNIGHFQRPKAGSNRWLIRQIGKFCRGCLAQKLSYGDRGIKDEFSHLRALFPPGVPEFQDLLDGQRLEALSRSFRREARSLSLSAMAGASTARTGTIRATGTPRRVMVNSSPRSTRSSRAERWVWRRRRQWFGS